MSKKKRTEKRQKAWQREMNLIGVAEFLPSCEDQETLLKPKTSVSDDESRCDLCGCTGDDLVEIDCSGETCMFCNELLHADADEPITETPVERAYREHRTRNKDARDLPPKDRESDTNEEEDDVYGEFVRPECGCCDLCGCTGDEPYEFDCEKNGCCNFEDGEDDELESTFPKDPHQDLAIVIFLKIHKLY